MILYFAPGSPFARIIRILARERGLALTEVETPLRDPAAPQLAHNPAGRVPALLDGGTLICETPLILAHLGWLPREPAALSRLGQALALLDGIAVWNRDLRRPPQERSPAFQALERMRAGRILDALDLPAHAPHSVEAVALACGLGYCDRRHTVFAWREGRQALALWYEDMIARPAFAETIPPVSGI
ncbi:glutathione S-transferase family protein [Sediminicoccus rosea]|jgi:glutathione S-transferase|uniref:Glutathione S-transferase N-terminal domain-containing protein n=1 Tax=Sediminicoccus rosea TaxID=1225128 RepID=A0ABZ0PE78_9PROT|nr:glutathione S-transferase N-terminal domain-containing protein [Sediminicoccus rosea]WPB84014.1 glutathione S-transferase N-terminal domain-containing protein [Sediminicoccus rosea]